VALRSSFFDLREGATYGQVRPGVRPPAALKSAALPVSKDRKNNCEGHEAFSCLSFFRRACWAGVHRRRNRAHPLPLRHRPVTVAEL
jgi:hypothetical protein